MRAIRDDIRSLGFSVEKTNTNVLLLAEAITVRAALKEDIAGLERVASLGHEVVRTTRRRVPHCAEARVTVLEKETGLA